MIGRDGVCCCQCSAERAGETIPAKFHPSKSFLTADNRPKKFSRASRARTSGSFAADYFSAGTMPKCFRRPCNLFSMAARRQALRNDPQLQRYVIPNVQPTGRQLGVGSYGSVEELEIISLICAGKRIHESLIEAGNVGVQRIVRKYVEECQLMSDLRHPHVVQFMGVCFLPDSSLPVLVMERLLMSLDNLLENTPDIPLAVKRSMLADVSKGLVYLHNRSSPIIHRDLSAKNILLNSAMVAKISDLGNSRIVDFQPGQLMKTLSRIPGTPVYMPPEALYSLPGYEADKSQYGTKIDIFSFGHLSLFTITQVGKTLLV